MAHVRSLHADNMGGCCRRMVSNKQVFAQINGRDNMVTFLQVGVGWQT
jgi:hypothetical protein